MVATATAAAIVQATVAARGARLQTKAQQGRHRAESQQRRSHRHRCAGHCQTGDIADIGARAIARLADAIAGTPDHRLELSTPELMIRDTTKTSPRQSGEKQGKA